MLRLTRHLLARRTVVLRVSGAPMRLVLATYRTPAHQPCAAATLGDRGQLVSPVTAVVLVGPARLLAELLDGQPHLHIDVGRPRSLLQSPVLFDEPCNPRPHDVVPPRLRRPGVALRRRALGVEPLDDAGLAQPCKLLLHCLGGDLPFLVDRLRRVIHRHLDVLAGLGIALQPRAHLDAVAERPAAAHLTQPLVGTCLQSAEHSPRCVVRLPAGLGDFDAQNETIIRAVEVTDTRRRGEADALAVGDGQQLLQVVRLTHQPVAVVDDDGVDLLLLDRLKHGVPAGPLAVALPGRPGVVDEDVSRGDRPVEADRKIAAVALLSLHLLQRSVRRVAQAAVNASPSREGLRHGGSV